MTKLLRSLSNIIKYSYRFNTSNVKQFLTCKKPPYRVVFFGSDEFSLYSLERLLKEYEKMTGFLSTIEVVTCSQKNVVWKYSMEHKLTVHSWPPDLTKNQFDLGLVVSFGHLIPEHIINKFPLGMLNVHASLLPRWRGASPIVYALANGDQETGVTIMRIKPNQFDVGEILYQHKIGIPPEMEMPELHKRLGELGAECLVENIKYIDERLKSCTPQPNEGVTYAPKITSEFSDVKWNLMTAREVYNRQRALKSISPLKTMWKSIPIKLHNIAIWDYQRESRKPGFVEYDRKNKLLIVECSKITWISVQKVGVYGKKIMSAADFYNGFMSKEDKNTLTCFQ